MNPSQEISKIKQILSTRLFEYSGAIYGLDIDQTTALPVNKQLSGRPLMRFVGTDEWGNTVMAWSHDCKSVEAFVVNRAEPPQYESVCTAVDQPEQTTTSYDFEPTGAVEAEELPEVTDYKPKRTKKRKAENTE